MRSPYTPPVSNSADWSDVAALQQRLSESADRIAAMAGDVGMAKHVLQYDADMRRRALARAMQPALAGGDSAAKAEAEGRSSPLYDKEIETLSKAHQAAEQTLAAFEAEKILWETARSLISLQRETMRQI